MSTNPPIPVSIETLTVEHPTLGEVSFLCAVSYAAGHEGVHFALPYNSAPDGDLDAARFCLEGQLDGNGLYEVAADKV